MEQLRLRAFQVMIVAALIVASMNLVNGQVSTSCTTLMMSSFTPCANIITGSTNNGLVPPSTCCDSLRSLMSTNMDCACMVISANAPFLQLPISQALALSLSRACNINGLALQCKGNIAASGSPLPASGPAVLGPNGPTLPSIAESPLSPQVSNMMGVDEAHKYENVELAEEVSATATATPSAVEVEAEAPITRTRIPQIRPVVLTPLSSHSTYVSPLPFAFLIGIMLFGIL